MKHFMKLNPKPFYMIKSGIKTIELRLCDKKRQQIHKNDEIEFIHIESGEKIIVRVKDIHRFSSFDELYKSLPLEKCGYTKEELKTAQATDMDKYYSKQQQEKYGAVGIEIELKQ